MQKGQKTKNFTSAFPSGFELKASRPPGCNGGVRLSFMTDLFTVVPYWSYIIYIVNALIPCARFTTGFLLDSTLKFKVCYCNHYNYCNDRHNVTIGIQDFRHRFAYCHNICRCVTLSRVLKTSVAKGGAVCPIASKYFPLMAFLFFQIMKYTNKKSYFCNPQHLNYFDS